MPDAAAAVLHSAGVSDPSTVGPGLVGFLVFFGLALATVLLVRSMVGHLRKVRYGPSGPDELGAGAVEPHVGPVEPQAGPAGGSGGEPGARTGGGSGRSGV